MTTDAPPAREAERPRGGRRQDRSRDGAILEATVEVLAEVGYVGLTMDLVAARASAGKATLYRRWASRDELVLSAVEHLRDAQIDLPELPDTGDLREDLLALFKPDSAEVGRRRRSALAALAALPREERFAGAVHSVLVEPWAEAHRRLMQRAVDRHEAAADADVEALCQVLPTMAAYRFLVQRQAFDQDLLLAVVDDVLMPALRHGPER